MRLVYLRCNLPEMSDETLDLNRLKHRYNLASAIHAMLQPGTIQDA